MHNKSGGDDGERVAGKFDKLVWGAGAWSEGLLLGAIDDALGATELKHVHQHEAYLSMPWSSKVQSDLLTLLDHIPRLRWAGEAFLQ